jgi:uncharacterized membrane protein YtjA (UPF0391 family)
MIKVLLGCLALAGVVGLFGFGGLANDGAAIAQAIFYIVVAIVAGALLRGSMDGTK